MIPRCSFLMKASSWGVPTLESPVLHWNLKRECLAKCTTPVDNQPSMNGRTILCIGAKLLPNCSQMYLHQIDIDVPRWHLKWFGAVVERLPLVAEIVSSSPMWWCIGAITEWKTNGAYVQKRPKLNKWGSVVANTNLSSPLPHQIS